jgi:hypothetical protein
MAEEAQLRVKADARQLQRVGREMERMGTAGARAVKRVADDLKGADRAVDDLRKNQERLNREFAKLDEGSRAWRKMREEIQQTNREAEKFSRGRARDSATGRFLPSGGGRARDPATGRFLPGGGGGGGGGGGVGGGPSVIARPGAGTTSRRFVLGGGIGGAFARQAIGAVGGGPEQTFGQMGQLSGAVGQALSSVPLAGPVLGLMGAVTQAGFNVMQRRVSQFLSAERAKLAAGAFIAAGGPASRARAQAAGVTRRRMGILDVARIAAAQGMTPEQAFGIMRGFGQAGGFRAGTGVLPLARMGFGPGAMAAAGLFAPGMSAVTTRRRGGAGLGILRAVTSQLVTEERRLGGRAGLITPGRVEERLTEMVGFLRSMSQQGIMIDPRAFVDQQRQLIRGDPGVFAGGRAFRFQMSMRQAQRRPGGLTQMASIMSTLSEGGDILEALEGARLGRVSAPRLMEQMGRLGLTGSRIGQFLVGAEIGRPMAEVRGAAGVDFDAPLPTPRGLGRTFGVGVPAGTRKILQLRTKELARGAQQVDNFTRLAGSVVKISDLLEETAKSNWNLLLEAIEKLPQAIADAVGPLVGPTMQAQVKKSQGKKFSMSSYKLK